MYDIVFNKNKMLSVITRTIKIIYTQYNDKK